MIIINSAPVVVGETLARLLFRHIHHCPINSNHLGLVVRRVADNLICGPHSDAKDGARLVSVYEYAEAQWGNTGNPAQIESRESISNHDVQ